MANWAKLQEQLTGLPVVKRARHGIHFKRADGQIEAHFSGKPCHYEDKGVWKPIDTTLLLGADGFYGCPHSPVKVHKDGRVKVDKSDYSQFTKLPGSPIGKVDGNRIVREFPGGRQYLYVTEDGFREEIVVDKPTFPLEKFIGKTSGTLPSAYKASPQTAVDANGDVFEITSDTKAFGDWLEGAVYPVVIDPDFSKITQGILRGGNANYDTSLTTVADYSTIPIVGQLLDGTTYKPYRTFFSFDTSSIGESSIITQANINMAVTTDNSATDFDVNILKADWSAYTPSSSRQQVYTILGNADVDVVWRNSSGISLNTYYESPNLDTAWISKTGTTYYGLRSDNEGSAPTGDERLYLDQWTKVILLSVTYTAGATGTLRRTNMNAQMSNLTGGMHG